MRSAFLVAIALLGAGSLRAQGHVHTPGMQHNLASPLPAATGQAAFAAISEVVRLLSADSTTDWSKVDIEALRQHLIDMDRVIMRASVRQTLVPGGVSLEVGGEEDVIASAQRMVADHATQLEAMPAYHATARRMPRGIVLEVTSRDPADTKTVNRIRALGLGGILAEGEHHATHHLMLARGGSPHHPR